MAGRIRTIKPELLEDERIAALSSNAFRLFIGCILQADDYGNLRFAAGHLAGTIFWRLLEDGRITVAEVNAARSELLAEGPIDRATGKPRPGLLAAYEVRGQVYAHISGWERHQKVDKPGAPRAPGPQDPEAVQISFDFRSVRDFRETLATLSRDSRAALATDPDLRSPISDQYQIKNPDSRPSPEPAGSASCPDDSEAPPGQPPTEAPGAEPLTSHAAQEPRHEAISVLNDPEPADHPESPAKAPQRPGNGQSTLFALTGPQPGEPTPPREPPPDPAQEVFDEYIVHWRRTVGARRAPVLDEKRRKLVKGRIRDGFTVEELKRACAGIWRSAWHVEQKQYDFSLVLRDASHVERFMALAPVAKNAVFSAPAAPAIDPEIAATEIPESARTAAGAAAFLRSMVDNIAETGLN